MIGKTLLVVAWFPLTAALLVVNLVLLASLANKTHPSQYQTQPSTGPQVTTAFSGSGQVLAASIIPGDARALLLRLFLERYDSPLSEYAEFIVREADAQGIDFRLLPAIAMCESGGGRRLPQRDSFNAWGIAVYTGQKTGKSFASWTHAIGWVSQYLKEKYLSQGRVSLADIGSIWAPPTEAEGLWSTCVGSFMAEIR